MRTLPSFARSCKSIISIWQVMRTSTYLPFISILEARNHLKSIKYNTREKLTGKAFQPKGMKLVMMLLLKPELVNQPMRVLAEQAEIALGTVKQVLDDLKQLTFILEKGKKGLVLNEKDLLLTRWLDAYPYNMDAQDYDDMKAMVFHRLLISPHPLVSVTKV